MDNSTGTAFLHAESPLRVVVADDHPVVLEGWRMVLATLPEAALVGVATTGSEAVRLVAEQHPHVVVMDLVMPELDGVEATRQITTSDPEVAVLVLSISGDDESITAALQAGARGYVLKGAAQPELALALRTVAVGQVTFGAQLRDRLLGRLTGALPLRPQRAFPNLTARETQILDMLAAGLPDSKIARQLCVEPKTVRNHIGNILPKLGATNRVEAALMAQSAGLGRNEPADKSPGRY